MVPRGAASGCGKEAGSCLPKPSPGWQGQSVTRGLEGQAPGRASHQQARGWELLPGLLPRCCHVLSGTVQVLGCSNSQPQMKVSLLGPAGFFSPAALVLSTEANMPPLACASPCSSSVALLGSALRVPVPAVSPLSHGRGHWAAEPLVPLRGMLWVWGLFVLAGLGFFFFFLSRKHLMFLYIWLLLPLEIWQRRQPRAVPKCQTG